jgi:hypothetical protein
MGSRASFRTAVAILVIGCCAALTPIGNGGTPDFGDPLAGLTAEQLEQFDEGKDEFSEVETVPEGLGPGVQRLGPARTVISKEPSAGRSSILETRFGGLAADGAFDPMSQFGGSLIQKNGIGVSESCDYLAELVPAEATIVAGRRTTPLFGLGLVDAVPDAAFFAIAAEEAFHPDHIKGKVSIVTKIATGRTRSASSAGSARTPRSSSSPATRT